MSVGRIYSLSKDWHWQPPSSEVKVAKEEKEWYQGVSEAPSGAAGSASSAEVKQEETTEEACSCMKAPWFLVFVRFKFLCIGFVVLAFMLLFRIVVVGFYFWLLSAFI